MKECNKRCRLQNLMVPNRAGLEAGFEHFQRPGES
jgi:hypothetical protein